MTLPYPGYSWSFNHHMGRINPKEIFFLLSAAYEFGQHPDYRKLINQFFRSQEVFTPNIRSDSGKVDTWRDYQQILSELGLIYSTRYTRQPKLTIIGLMYIDSIIGYSELFSTQILSYQYPNGHKTDISPAIKKELSQAGITVPTNRIELDTSFNILIKPGVLILQILIELYRQGNTPTISTQECLLTLVPTQNNSQWKESYSELIQLRYEGTSSSQVDTRRLRDVQEWFQFMGQSDFIIKQGNQISLSHSALERISIIQSIIDIHTEPTSFWIPESSDKRVNALDWYSFYGNPEIKYQWSTPDELRTQNYVAENFPDNQSIKQDDSSVDMTITDINLRPFSSTIPQTADIDREVNLNRIIQGRNRLRTKTRLHQEILVLLASKLTDLSYNIAEDPSSVDLLAEKDGVETIFEVKTINYKNFIPRIRLGIGQLSEYRYRRQIQTCTRPNSILVVSNLVDFPTWTSDYLSSDIEMGLICSRLNSFVAITNGSIELEIQNR